MVFEDFSLFSREREVRGEGAEGAGCERLGEKCRFGSPASTVAASSCVQRQDLVIGVINTGIWPERGSFNDRDLGPVPDKWKEACVVSKDFTATSCNRKLIGARFFCNGYEATNGRMNESSEYQSPRDSDGHGTHTASIAAEKYVSPASTLGYASGVAAGMAPKAHLAVYKVCWPAGCYDSDILVAFDAAMSDGVDVVSLSIGGVMVPYYLDVIAIGAFGATDHGVFVSASAGNGGPGGLTVTNVAPWVTTVGAGSIDRDFPADVKLGDGRVVSGVSVYSGPGFWIFEPTSTCRFLTLDAGRRRYGGRRRAELEDCIACCRRFIY